MSKDCIVLYSIVVLHCNVFFDSFESNPLNFIKGRIEKSKLVKLVQSVCQILFFVRIESRIIQPSVVVSIVSIVRIGLDWTGLD